MYPASCQSLHGAAKSLPIQAAVEGRVVLLRTQVDPVEVCESQRLRELVHGMLAKRKNTRRHDHVFRPRSAVANDVEVGTLRRAEGVSRGDPVKPRGANEGLAREAAVDMHLVIPLPCRFDLKIDWRQEDGGRCGCEQDPMNEMQRPRPSATGNCTDIPDDWPPGVDMGCGYEKPATLAMLVGDCAHHRVVDGLGDDRSEPLVRGERVAEIGDEEWLLDKGTSVVGLKGGAEPYGSTTPLGAPVARARRQAPLKRQGHRHAGSPAVVVLSVAAAVIAHAFELLAL